jgi:outer membrane murein-binding lipoprotein Lpp
MQSQGAAHVASGPAFVPPPIDTERRNRSPGLQNSFYDVSIADFKRPHGMPGGAVPVAAPEPPAAAAAASDGHAHADVQSPPRDPAATKWTSAAEQAKAAWHASMGGTANHTSAGYGAESPMPGREREYEAHMQSQGAAHVASGPAFVPPPIDTERRSRSPGLRRNFYDVSIADFKRPHGMPGGAVPVAASEPPPAAAANAVTSHAATPIQEPAEYGVETPLPGREGEYEAHMQSQGAAHVASRPAAKEGGSRSPDLLNNVHDTPTAAASALPLASGAVTSHAATPIQEAAEYGVETPLPAASTIDDGVHARVARLERSNERLESALSEMRSREEAAMTEAAEAKAREESLSGRLELSNERLESALSEMRAAEGAARREAAEARAREESYSQRLERSNERLEAAMSEVRAGEEAATMEAAEARVREDSLARRLELSNERLESALSEMRSREEAAMTETAEAKAREESLSWRLAALEARVGTVAPGPSTAGMSVGAGAHSSRLSQPVKDATSAARGGKKGGLLRRWRRSREGSAAD